MKSPEELLLQYTHSPEEFPVLSRQTHKVMKNGKIENELININENIIHYLRDTVALISMIDGSAEATGRKTYPYDHVVYLDKSARPVSWLVNMF